MKSKTIILYLSLLIEVLFTQTVFYSQTHGIKLNQYSHGYFQKEDSFSIDSDPPLTKVGQWAWGPCYSVAVKDKYAFIGNGLMLQVLDVSNPAVPKVIGELMTGNPIRGIVVNGNYAYTITPFQIFDVSNPAKPTLVSIFQLPYGYPPTAITVRGNYAYVGDFYGFIFIIDVSDSHNPHEVGSMLASGKMVQSIEIKDTVLYAVTYDSPGTDIFNISNPESPIHIRLAGTGSIPGSALAINNNYLYFGTSRAFYIYDISNPSNPRYINGILLPSIVRSISIVDTTAFLIVDTEGLVELDISHTNNIHILSKIKYPHNFLNVEGGIGIEMRGLVKPPFAYVSASTGLWIVDISNQNSMSSVLFFSTGWYVNRIAVDSSNHAFLAELYGGLKIVDYSIPSSPKLIGQFNPDEEVIDVVVSGNFAYLLCDTHLQVIDIANPNMPKFLGEVPFGDTIPTNPLGRFDFLCLNGSTIYAARKSKRLFTIDVSNPSNPEINRIVTLRGIPVGISKSNGYLYVADFDTGLQIFDISNPHTPTQVGFLNIVPLRGIATDKNKLFVTDVVKLSKYEISDMLHPKFEYSVNLMGGYETAQMYADNSFVYIANTGAFIIINISKPDSARIMYSENAININGNFNSIAVSNKIVLAGNIGIRIYTNNFITKIKTTDIPPKSVELFQNYPNPFNPRTLIKYQLSVESHVSLKIFDVLGRELQTLVNAVQQVGIYLIPFEGSKYSGGIYFYRLETISTDGKESFSTKKMELLK
ncbi:MAG: T9SS type A sorting domain-containing protein [Bacteroidota bacterium]